MVAAEDLRRAGRLDEARRSYQRLRRESPGRIRPFLQEISLTTKDADVKALEADLDALVSVSDSDRQRALLKSLQARLARDVVRREQLLAEALKLDDQCCVAHLTMAETLDARGDVEKAFESWKRAATSSKVLPSALRGYGLALIEKGEYLDAVRELENYVRFETMDEEVYYNLGTLLLTHVKDYSKAWRMLKKAYELKPDDLDVLMNFSVAAMHNGHYDDAHQALERAKRIAPSNPDVYFNLAVYYADHRRDKRAAISNFETYLNLGGTEIRRVNKWLEDLRGRQPLP